MSDTDTGDPVAGVLVTATGAGSSVAAATTGNDGSYRLDDLDAGTYTILTEVDGYGTAPVTDVLVASGQTTTVDLTLDLVATADPDPDPVPIDDPATDACPGGLVPPSGFVDPVGNLHEAAIDCAAWHGIIRGVTDRTFLPAGLVTRGQMASFVARTLAAAGVVLPEVDEPAIDDTVGSGHADRIAQLAGIGVVQGHDDGRYHPRAPVTRAQTASLLVRAASFAGDEPLSAPTGPFTDTAGSTHRTAIDAAFAAGCTEGRPATTFEPDEPTRRDQMATFVTRLLERFAAEGRVPLPDA